MLSIIPIVLSVLLTVFLIYVLWKFFQFNNGRVEVTLLFVASICFYYGFGTFLGLVVAPPEISEFLLTDAGLNVDDLIGPLFLVIACAAFIFFIGRRFKSFSFRKEQIVDAIESIVSQKANLVVYIVFSAVQAYLLVSGKVAFGGVQTDEVETHRVSALALLVAPLTYAALVIAGYMILNLRTSYVSRYFYRWLFISQFSYVFIGDRKSTRLNSSH